MLPSERRKANRVENPPDLTPADSRALDAAADKRGLKRRLAEWDAWLALASPRVRAHPAEMVSNRRVLAVHRDLVAASARPAGVLEQELRLIEEFIAG